MANPADATRNVFWDDDRTWQLAWPTAVAGACVMHVLAFMFANQDTVKVKEPTITMAIVAPEPPPPPPLAPEPPKPPEKKPPKLASLPPPSAAAPPEPTPQPPQEVPQVAEPVNLGPKTGEGVAVPLGAPDGTPGAKPLTGQALATPQTSIVQQGPPTPSFDARGYRDGALEAVNKQKRYPRKAEVLGLEGQCLVKVALDADGNIIGEPEIIGKGTGHDILDAEAIRMVKATKFQRLPPDVKTPYVMRFPVMFKLIDAVR